MNAYFHFILMNWSTSHFNNASLLLCAISIETFDLIFDASFCIGCDSVSNCRCNFWKPGNKHLHNSRIQFPHLILGNVVFFIFSCVSWTEHLFHRNAHVAWHRPALQKKGYWIKSKITLVDSIILLMSCHVCVAMPWMCTLHAKQNENEYEEFK